MSARVHAVLTLALAAVLCHCAPPESAPGPDSAPEESTQALTPGGGLRFMTYNIKHGELSSLEAIASVINGQAPDLVAVQEVDVLTTRSGKVDQATRLGQLTGLYSAFVPSLTSFEGWGPFLIAAFLGGTVLVVGLALAEPRDPRDAHLDDSDRGTV